MNQIDQAIHYYKQQREKVLNDIRVDEDAVSKIDAEIAIIQAQLDNQLAEKQAKEKERHLILEALGQQKTSYQSLVQDVRSLVHSINRQTSVNMTNMSKRKPTVPNRTMLSRTFSSKK
ncbi:hypothetical protein RCL1_006426 [Eukaryota sp. TZLM3-RCL]